VCVSVSVLPPSHPCQDPDGINEFGLKRVQSTDGLCFERH
jgi:hypothetical protein